MTEIRLAQYFELTTGANTTPNHRYQNYFVGTSQLLDGVRYELHRLGRKVVPLT